MKKKEAGVKNFFKGFRKKSVNDLHKWKKELLFADKILSVIVILLFGLFRVDYLMIAVYFLIYPYLLLTNRKKAIYHLLVSSIIAIIWMIFAGKEYGYNREMLVIFGLNSYALFSWAVGLFIVYLIYSHFEHYFSSKNFLYKVLIFSLFYVPLLLFVETIAYHIFNIKNLATAMYVGLPICNCIHAPVWMQVMYILMGPIYFLICELIGLENPHF